MSVRPQKKNSAEDNGVVKRVWWPKVKGDGDLRPPHIWTSKLDNTVLVFYWMWCISKTSNKQLQIRYEPRLEDNGDTKACWWPKVKGHVWFNVHTFLDLFFSLNAAEMGVDKRCFKSKRPFLFTVFWIFDFICCLFWTNVSVWYLFSFSLVSVQFSTFL